MHPHLEQLVRRSRTNSARVTEMARGLSPGQLAWRPSTAVWSVLDVLEHLVKTCHAYAPYVGPAIERAAGSGHGDDPFRPGWFGKKFIEAVGPNTTRTVNAPRIFGPAGGSTDVGMLDRFADTQSQIEMWIAEADGASLNGRKFRSPVTFLLRLTIGEGLTVLVDHTTRHVKQAVRLRDRPDFPSF